MVEVLLSPSFMIYSILTYKLTVQEVTLVADSNLKYCFTAADIPLLHNYNNNDKTPTYLQWLIRQCFRQQTFLKIRQSKYMLCKICTTKIFLLNNFRNQTDVFKIHINNVFKTLCIFTEQSCSYQNLYLLLRNEFLKTEPIFTTMIVQPTMAFSLAINKFNTRKENLILEKISFNYLKQIRKYSVFPNFTEV